jgi:hypothetical protein
MTNRVSVLKKNKTALTSVKAAMKKNQVAAPRMVVVRRARSTACGEGGGTGAWDVGVAVPGG